MPLIRPISDLRNKAKEIPELAHDTDEPVFITRNGEGDMVMMSMMAQYAKLQSRLEVLGKLAVAQSQRASGEKGRPLAAVMEDLRKHIRESARVAGPSPSSCRGGPPPNRNPCRPERPSPAEALVDRIQERLAQVSRHPELGSRPSEDDLARIGYQYVVVENYLTFYMVEGRTVFVHRNLHGARDYLGLLQLAMSLRDLGLDELHVGLNLPQEMKNRASN